MDGACGGFRSTNCRCMPRISLRCTDLPPVPAARQLGLTADSDRPQAEAAKARSGPERVLPSYSPCSDPRDRETNSSRFRPVSSSGVLSLRKGMNRRSGLPGVKAGLKLPSFRRSQIPQMPQSLSVVEDRLPNGSRCCIDLDDDVATHVISVRQELPRIESTFHVDRFRPCPSSSLALGNSEILRLITRQSLRGEEPETTQQTNHSKKETGARTDFVGVPGLKFPT